MAFDGLAEKLGQAFKKLKSKGKLSESDVKEAMREVRLALLEADVNYKVAKDFTKTVTERAVGSDVMESLTPAQMVIKIVNEELTRLMGGEQARLQSPSHPPAVLSGTTKKRPGAPGRSPLFSTLSSYHRDSEISSPLFIIQ